MRALTVLLVEDQLLDLKLLRALLHDGGHRALQATDVAEARAQLATTVPDVVLMAVEIPGGGGDRLVRDMRRDARLAAVPVVAVTTAACDDGEHWMRLAFDGWIAKPIDARTFCLELESFVGEPG